MKQIARNFFYAILCVVFSSLNSVALANPIPIVGRRTKESDVSRVFKLIKEFFLGVKADRYSNEFFFMSLAIIIVFLLLIVIIIKKIKIKNKTANRIPIILIAIIIIAFIFLRIYMYFYYQNRPISFNNWDYYTSVIDLINDINVEPILKITTSINRPI